jgi:hypothetical protein
MKAIIPALALCIALPTAVVIANPGQPHGSVAPPVPRFATHRPPMAPLPGAPVPEAGVPGPHFIAHMLAALENEIGIRQEQLEAWRNFTDALLAVTQPPRPPAALGKVEAFAMPTAIAADLAERAKRAEDLMIAVSNLRSTLTPDQLERAKRAEAALPR